MKEKWRKDAEKIALSLKQVPGALVGVAVDNDEKADAFVEYWAEKHPHVDVVDRNYLLSSTFMRIRLKGTMQ